MSILNEKLDFNFSFADIKAIDTILNDYIKERSDFYSELFCSEESFTQEDVNSYLYYFTGYISDTLGEDEEVNPKLTRLLHFFSRNYEVFTIEPIAKDVSTILCYLQGEYLSDNLSFEEISEMEVDAIQNLTDTWQELSEKFADYPLLNIDKMQYKDIDGVQVYYDANTQPYAMEEFEKFVKNVNKVFPNTLLRLDSFILVDPDYISFVAGEGTLAYFLDDTIFFGSSVKNIEKCGDDREFYSRILYHEFGHFIFDLLSESSQIFWFDKYSEWKDKQVKMSRDEMKYDPEDELWADSFSFLFEDTKEGFIHKPSEIIIDTVKFLLNKEFN